MKSKFADAYAAKRKGTPSIEDAQVDFPETEDFLSSEGNDELSDVDMHLFEAPHLDEESPFKKALRRRMQK